MASFYKLSKLFFGLRSRRLRLLALAAAHGMRMRYIGVFADPAMSCNLRCKMCYFSDPESAPHPTRPMTLERLDALLPRAAKLQLGCGAEPTLYRQLPALVERARQKGVPYIELTTNGQLLTLESLKGLIAAGLGGMTLSVHGTSADTYEYLMGGARFDRLLALVETLRAVKREHPDFKLRINYTFNNLNVGELQGIWQLFDGVHVDVLQVRPIQRLGETAYSDFDLTAIIDDYDRLIEPVRERCRQSGTLFVGPTRDNLRQVDTPVSPLDQAIEEATYYYVSPDTCNKEGLDLERDTFGAYSRRKHILWRLIKTALLPAKNFSPAPTVTKKMNYTVR